MIINLRHLKAVAEFASTELTRYYLNGVCVRDNMMSATDGHCLAAIRLAGTQLDEFIIPKSLLDKFKLTRGSDSNADLTINGERFITIAHEGFSVSTYAIDGTFPQWKSVIPKGEVSGVAAQFNQRYTSLFAKAANMIGADIDKIAIHHNGPEPALVDWCGNEAEGFGVIMPVMSFSCMTSAPSWAR